MGAGTGRALRAAVEELLRHELGAVGVHRLCPRCGSAEHGRPSIRLAHGTAPSVSWSYAGDVAVVAWTRDGSVGVDLEPAGAGGHLEAWTRAEAVLKATGEGLTRSPEGITPEDAWVQRLTLPPAYVGHVAVAGARDVEPGVSWRLVGPAAPSG